MTLHHSLLKELVNPNSVVAVLVKVVDIGPSRIDHNKAAGTAYTVVRVQLWASDTDAAILLWDDQQRLAALWRVGMVLLLFRPFVAYNREEPLFGVTTHVPAAMAYSVVSRPAPELANWPADAAPVHFMYGTITAVALMAGMDRLETPRRRDGKGSSRVSSSRSSSSSKTCVDAGDVGGGDLLVRLLGIDHGGGTSSNGGSGALPVPPIHHPASRVTPTGTTLLVATAGSVPGPGGCRLMKVVVAADACASLAPARPGHLLWLAGLQVTTAYT